MGWLWTCLGGGPTIQAQQLFTEKAVRARSHRGRVSNQPHDLRFHQIPTHLPKNGYGGLENSQMQAMAGRGKCGEPEKIDSFRIPTSSVSTCISINTLKKASEATLGSSFRTELGLSLRSDVDELKEELAALRRRLANEEAEAKKLREEITLLRSCGLLQKSEDALALRTSQNPLFKDTCNADAEVMKQQGDAAPIKHLRKCFSGPMLLDEHSTLSSHPSGTPGRVVHSAHARISSHRAGLSPKSQFNVQEADDTEDSTTHQSSHQGEEAAVVSNSISTPSKTRHNNGQEQYSSLTVGVSVKRTPKEGYHEAVVDHNRGSGNTMDVHWIEVANAPCPSSSSTNVKKDIHHSKDDVESPRKPSRAALAGPDALVKEPHRLGGKRRPKRSGDNEPTEKRAKDQSLVTTSESLANITEEVEAQMSEAVTAFKQQKHELEAKHQSFCQGSTTSTTTRANLSNLGVVSLFRNSRKRSVPIRNRGFRRSLSPVKEALSLEEISWSRQSSRRNESGVARELEGSLGSTSVTSDTLHGIMDASTQYQRFTILAKAAEVVESSPSRMRPILTHSDEQGGDVDNRPSAMEKLALVPIQCASPSLSPKKRSASSALDALCALAATTNGLHSSREGRYDVEDSVEGTLQEPDWAQACDWDDEVDVLNIKPIECASPSFSPRRKNTRGAVSQSVTFEPENLSSLLNCSTGLPEDCSELGGKSRSSIDTSFQSPNQAHPKTPLKQWTPPQKNIDFQTNDEQSWCSDAIDAIQNISDIRGSKERRLLSESVCTEKPQRQLIARPPHCYSAEKKVLRRAFSWYVSEHDERMRTFGLKDRSLQKEGEEREKKGKECVSQQSLVSDGLSCSESLRRPASSEGKHVVTDFRRGTLVRNRKYSDTDSGGTATFSIDFNRTDSSQGENEHGALDVVDSYNANVPYSSFRQTGVDKENVAARIVQASSKNNMFRTPERKLSPSDSNRHRRSCSQDVIPETRCILGAVPVNYWDNSGVKTKSLVFNSTDNYEDTIVGWHATPFQERVERAVPRQPPMGYPSKYLTRSKSLL